MTLDDSPTGGPMFDRSRPYDGQPHTDAGERGLEPLVSPWGAGTPAQRTITMRDIHDAVLIGILQAKKRPDAQYTNEVFGPGSYSDEASLPLPPERIETDRQLREELAKDPDFDPVAAAQNATCEVEKRLGIYPNVPELRVHEGGQS